VNGTRGGARKEGGMSEEAAAPETKAVTVQPLAPVDLGPEIIATEP